MKTYKLKINGHDYEVVVNSVENNVANVTVNGAEYTVNVDRGTLNVDCEAGCSRREVKQRGTLNDNTKSTETVDNKTKVAASEKAEKTGNAGGEATFNVVSPLPGVILDICVKEGDEVKEGQKVVVLEAMKMENAILAEKAGVVKKVHVSQGESVLEEAVLVTIG